MPSQFLSHEKSASQTSLRAISGEQELAFWMISFSTSHIGMSAIRDKLISGCGQLASYVNLVDRGVKLPSYWPGKFDHIQHTGISLISGKYFGMGN